MEHTLPVLFGLRRRVERRPYLLWGLLLAALKCGIESAIVCASTHKLWSPIGYLIPSLARRQSDMGQGPLAMHLLLVVCALPVLWLGLTTPFTTVCFRTSSD